MLKSKKVFALWTLFFSFWGLSFAQELTFAGIIKPMNDIELSLPIDGVLSKIVHKEGEKIKAGQTLLLLDDELQRLEVERRHLLWEDRSKVEAGLYNRRIVKDLLDSTQKLYDKTKSVSYDELQKLKMHYADLNGEVQNLLMNESKEKVEYQLSKAMLEKYALKSPIDGTIAQINFEIGEWIKMGDAVVRIVNTQQCYIDANIDTYAAQKLHVHDKIVFFIANSNEDKRHNGLITFISPVADQASSLIRVKVEFDNTKLQVVPGGTAMLVINE